MNREDLDKIFSVVRMAFRFAVVPMMFGMVLSGCTPRVEVAVPDKPIEININAKIDHEVRIKVEKDVDNLFNANSKLF